MSYNRSKFNFSETFNNQSGKTSGSGFIGVIAGLIGCAGIIAGIFGYFFGIPNTLEYFGVMLKVLTASAILLGVRRLSGDFNSKNLADADEQITQTAINGDLAAVKADDITTAKENEKTINLLKVIEQIW
jgi:membrane-bound ClpP family serine protease